jgi:ABC-type transport system involved in multi-copper enzyme maturation permease subunit
MVRRFIRQKFGSGGLVVALVVLAILETLNVASRGVEHGFAMAGWAVFVLAAGSVSRDVSSGALQMILSRPIRRTQYLFGRYLGILLSFGLFLIGTAILATLFFQLVVRRSVTTPVSPPSLAGVAVAVGNEFFGAALQASILLFFSTFLPGIADLLGLLLLYLVLNLPQMSRAAWLRHATESARENMLPTVDWSELLRGGPLHATAGRWVFAVAIYLALAVVVFSRRELPYGQD